MRLPFLSLLLLLASPSVAFGQHESPNRADWGEWARTFSAYAEHPSAGNAEAVEKAFLPSARRDSLTTPPSLDSVYAWLDVLARRIKARDSVAVQLAFVIEPSMGSGDLSETLDIMLGQLIRIAPRLFLSELQAQEQRQGRVSVPGGNLGEEYVDRMQAQCRELHLRIRAIRSVSDASLATTKRLAIAELESAAQEVCGS